MHVVTLSPSARAHLSGQLTHCHRTERGFICALPLTGPDKTAVDIAVVTVLPHSSEASVLVQLCGTQTSTTLPRRELSPANLSSLMAEHLNVNGTGYPEQLEAYADLSGTLHMAVRLHQGEFLLPGCEPLELCLVIERPSLPNERDRATFRFVLDGVIETMSTLLPNSVQSAHQLLLSVAWDIINKQRAKGV